MIADDAVTQGVISHDIDLALAEYSSLSTWGVNSLRSKQNGGHFADDTASKVFP